MARHHARHATESDRVRDFVYHNYVAPARKIKAASITVIAGDVYRALHLKNQNRMALVCDALDAKKFQAQHSIRLSERSGHKHGADTAFTFSLHDATLMLSRKFSPTPHSLTALPDEHFRNHVPDSAGDALLERWTKLGEAVLAQGAPTEDHISEMTALARAEQEQIKRKMRRAMRMYRQGQEKAA